MVAISPPLHSKNTLSLPSEADKLLDELELVSRVASHDLQAPLRVMQVYCEELRNNPCITDKSGQSAVEMLAIETARARLLLQAVIDYIRLETYNPPLSPLDANVVMATALKALESEIADAGAVITCGSLPQIKGHRGRLTRLFIHLLENALKFGKSPQIRVSAHAHEGRWVFCMEDNGIGVAEEHHEIIFTLFQRLHTAEAYPGHGIGLALSRKIVEAHGGRIWLESVQQKGSRFYFTLPAVHTITQREE